MKTVENGKKQYVTKKEFCKICGISESTAYKLIKYKKVNFEKCREGLLHYYKIPICEIEKLLKEKEAKKFISDEDTETIKYYYANKMLGYPDVIDSKDIQAITGYGKEIVRVWINTEKILGIVTRGKFHVAKEDLLDFLISPYYSNIIRKSKIHIADFKKIGIIWKLRPFLNTGTVFYIDNKLYCVLQKMTLVFSFAIPIVILGNIWYN